MRTTSVVKIKQLQQNTANLRNICILAHVDHGKLVCSSLSDVTLRKGP